MINKITEKMYEYMELNANHVDWLVSLNKLGEKGWKVKQYDRITGYYLLEREYISLADFREDRINKILD